ncbi:hypothetical protein [Burkholderia pseudomultivorans]|uniref:hypothetical protein n=1 Tax=Burkholderia pseudomultivorans TaxID=1207504 RepID=UPI00188DDB40|nr:hypothetical protein [Burkholderia pseudomultivorans]MBF5013650.1 hypothetical protein [Burkholderia pseudomultivorans]
MTDISSLRIGDSRFVGWSENGNRPAPVDTPGEAALRGPFATANCQVGQCGGGSGGWRGRVERLALRDAHPSLRAHVSDRPPLRDGHASPIRPRSARSPAKNRLS